MTKNGRQTPKGDASQKFTKIHCSAGSEVEIEYSTSPRAAVTATHSHKAKELPHPDFVAAMAVFLPLATKLLELKANYLEEARVSTVAISYGKDGRRGLVITIVRTVDATSSPFV